MEKFLELFRPVGSLWGSPQPHMPQLHMTKNILWVGEPLWRGWYISIIFYIYATKKIHEIISSKFMTYLAQSIRNIFTNLR